MSGPTSPDSVQYPEVGYGLTAFTDSGTGFANYITLDGSAEDEPVVIQARGLDDNIDIALQPKGTGGYVVGNNWPAWWVISGSATYPTITVNGSLANIDAKVIGKGSGYLNTQKLFVGSSAVRALIDTRTVVYLRTSQTYTGGSQASFFAGGLYSGFGSGDVQFNSWLAEDSVTTGTTMFRVHHVLKAGAGGGHTAVSNGLTIAEAVDGGATTNFQVAHGAITRVTATHSGLPGNPRGNLFARNAIMVAGNGAGGHVASLIGDEVDTTISARVGVSYHIGVSSVLHKDGTGNHNHERRGSLQDTAFSIGSAANDGATVGWRIGIGVGSPTGWAGNPDTRLIATEPVAAAFAPVSRTYELADVIDMTGLAAINRSLYITNNAALDGNGNSGAQVAAGVSLQTRSAINAKTAVVASLTPLLPDGGGLYSASGVPTVTIDAPPGSGTTATATIATHGAQEILSMTNGGTGYAVNQILTQGGGTGTAATVRVLRVDGTGKIRELMVETAGNYSVLPVGEQSFTGGTGTGLSCALLYTARTFTVSGAGTNYPEFPAPVARYTGGTVFRPPVIVVTMTATQTALSLNPGGGLTITASALGNYANDAAAAAGGVAVNGVYRNGSVLMVRVS